MDLWLAGPETRKLLEKAIAEWHPDLADIDNRIAIVMKEKAAKSGGQVILGASKKASPLIKALSKAWADEEILFILEIAGDCWIDLDNNKRLALVDHLLCSCGVKEDPKKGTTYFIRKPEIQVYASNIRRFGFWMDIPGEDDDDAGDDGDHAATVIEGLFGKKKDDGEDE